MTAILLASISTVSAERHADDSFKVTALLSCIGLATSFAALAFGIDLSIQA
jgi:hypothetical protein